MEAKHHILNKQNMTENIKKGNKNIHRNKIYIENIHENENMTTQIYAIH